MSHKKTKKFPIAKFLTIFFTYFTLFIVLSGIIDYYADMVFNFLYFVLFSVLLALPMAYLHIKKGKKDHIDEVANELF